MHRNAAAVPLKHAVALAAFVLFGIFALRPLCAAPASGVRTFDIAAGDAGETLKTFAVQARREIMFPAEPVQGVKTHAVKGVLAPRDALERMLASTGLFVVEDAKTGALMINRTPPPRRPAGRVPSEISSNSAHDSPPVMKRNSPIARFGAWLGLVFASTQADGAAGSAPTSTNDTLVLSPFEVNADKDVGYQAGNTTSGSRLNTSLKDTAAAIMVFTPEYISDFGANTLADVVAYAPNLQIDTMDASADALPRFLDQSDLKDTRIRVRGLSASTSRDFFETSVPIDNYNTERFELSSGPNSILFGFGSPGGLINVMTKRAQVNRTRTGLRFQFGEWDFSRYEVDHNQVILPNRLALRLNGLRQNSGSWRKWDFNDTTRGAASLRFEPWKKTAVTVNYEKGELLSHLTRPMNAIDGLALWQASGASLKNDNAWTAADRASGINRNTTVRNIYITDAAGSPPVFLTTSNAANFRLLESTYEDFTVPAAQRVGATLLPRTQLPFDYSVAGPGSTRDLDLDRVVANVEQRLPNDITVELAYTRERTKQLIVAPAINTITLSGDPNTVIPNPSGTGAPIPNPNAGRLHLDSNWAFDRGEYSHEAYRASAAWKLALGKFGVHNIAAMAEHGSLRQFRYPGREILVDAQGVPINNAAVPENAANQLLRRQYVVPGNYDTYVPGNGTDPVSVTRNGRSYHNVWVNQSTAGGDVERTMDTLLAATQSYFMDNRLVVTAGVRWDNITFDQYGGARLSAHDPRVVSGEAIANTWAFTSQIEDSLEYEPVTSTMGGVFHATRVFSVFYNHANNNAQPPFHLRILPDEKLPPPADGKSDDFGFMLNLLDGRIFLRATAYRTLQLNSSGGAFSTTGLRTGSDDIVGPTTRLLDTLREHNRITDTEYTQHLLGDQGNLTTTYNIVNRGIELSSWFNLSRNLTAVLNFSYTKSNRSDIFPEFEEWFERENAFWHATPGAGALVNSTFGSSVDQEAEVLQEAVRGIREFYGFRYGERPYKANVSGRYSFTEGWARGLFAGGGVRWQSTSKLGRVVTSVAANGRKSYGDTIEGPEDFKMDAFVGYRRRMPLLGRSSELTLQMNVTNLTDEDEWMPLRYNANQSGLTRVLLFEPRRVRLTVGLSF